MPKVTKDSYNAHILAIRTMAREWCELHALARPVIRYSLPGGRLIGTVPDALRGGFMSANEDGLQLLREIGAFNENRQQPTVAMVQAALEGLDVAKGSKGRRPRGLDD